MKTARFVFSVRCVVKALVAVVSIAGSAVGHSTQLATQLALFAEDDPLTPESYRLVWSANPGHRYEVWESPDLQSWTVVPGFPVVAAGPTAQMPFVAGDQTRFFQVRELDDQPPVIVNRYPTADGFAVPRFGGLKIDLADVSGVDPTSIRLTVGALGTFSAEDSQITFSESLLSFDAGTDIALGDYAETITASLIVADILGNRGTNTWSFDLEVEPKVVENLFVFGSPQARLMGQRLPVSPTVSLSTRPGPIPLSSSSPWTLESVHPERLLVAYTGASGPPIETGTYLCNLTPTTIEEIFYRKVTELTDDPATGRMTLLTVDVPLAEILEQGSGLLSAGSVVYQVDDNGGIIQPRAPGLAAAFDHELILPAIGGDWSGRTVLDEGGVTLTLDEALFRFTPTLRVAFETGGLSVQRFEARARGNLETALVPHLRFNTANLLAGEREINLFLGSHLIFLGMVGPVPVWLDLKFALAAALEHEVAVSGDLRMGIRQNLVLGVGADYQKDRTPTVAWERDRILSVREIVPFTFQMDGSASATAKLIPRIDLTVNSLAGIWVSADPRVEVSGTAAFVGANLQSAQWALGAHADLHAGLIVRGISAHLLPQASPLKLFSWETVDSYPHPDRIVVHRQPTRQTAVEGDSVTIAVDAVAGRPLSYQWYHRGTPVVGQTGPLLRLSAVEPAHSGEYFVRLRAGNQNLDSAAVQLTVSPRATSGLGSWQLPLEGRWNPSRWFGEHVPNDTTSDRYHLAHDVPREQGTPVYAAFDGIVKHAGPRGGGYGYVVVIEHDLGSNTKVCSVYGHLREEGIAPLGAVTKGQPIGYTTGVKGEYGTNPHLHFGIRTGAYSEDLDFDGEWRYRGYGPSRIVPLWIDPFDIIPLPNLVPQAIRLNKTTLNPGDTLTITWRLANTGRSSSPGTGTGVRITQSADSTDGPTLDNVPMPALGPGSWVEQSSTVSIPPTYAPGTYHVWIVADNVAESAISQSNFDDDFQRSAPFSVWDLPSPPPGMVLIPAGPFMMGDSMGDGWEWESERPVRTVEVSAFYMDRTEVTKALWDEVYQWAAANGYQFDNRGSWWFGKDYSKGANHPVHTVSWYDVVKWCNARSEKEGLTDI